MVFETIIGKNSQLVYHKQGKDVFSKLTEHVVYMCPQLTSAEILAAFHEHKTGTLRFNVGEHEVIWHFE